MTTYDDIRTRPDAPVEDARRDLTILRTADLAAVLYLAGITVKEETQNHNVFGDPIVASLLLNSYYKLDEEFNTANKTAAEAVSEY
jgi:hypothetical protein